MKAADKKTSSANKNANDFLFKNAILLKSIFVEKYKPEIKIIR